MDGGNLSIQILETLRAKGFPPLGLRECQGDFGPFCTALAAGGDRLDCFDGFLSVLYPMFGFIPVARVKFDPKFAPEKWQDEFGTPDIVFFKHCGHSPEKTAGLIGSYPDYPDLFQLPCLNSYEEAREYRDNDMASGR